MALSGACLLVLIKGTCTHICQESASDHGSAVTARMSWEAASAADVWNRTVGCGVAELLTLGTGKAWAFCAAMSFLVTFVAAYLTFVIRAIGCDMSTSSLRVVMFYTASASTAIAGFIAVAPKMAVLPAIKTSNVVCAVDNVVGGVEVFKEANEVSI